MKEKKKKTENEISSKKRDGRNIVPFVIVSVLVCFGVLILGILFNKADRISSQTASVLLAVLGLTPIVLTLIFWLVNRRIGKRENARLRNVAEMRAFLTANKENAEKSAKKELALLCRIRFFTYLWAVVLGLIALCFAFLSGCISRVAEFGVLLLFYAVLLFCVSLSELWRYTPKIEMPQNFELAEEEFPALYALAGRAQKQVGGKGEIRIFWEDNTDSPVGIASCGEIVEILIDIVALNLFTEEELYAILLHEFAHLDSSNEKDNAVSRYGQKLWRIKDSADLFSRMEQTVFLLFHNLYIWRHMLYSFISSIDREIYADNMMKECSQAAATSLVKIRYCAYAHNEREYDERIQPSYLPEEPPEHYYSDILAQIRDAFSVRADFWNSLIEKEILALNASHPTIISRIRALGFDTVPPLSGFPTGEWQKACEKVLQTADRHLCDTLSKKEPGYQEQRERNYLQPLAAVTEWEEKGKPVVAEEYADIMLSMLRIGRVSDALALAERAIAELPAAASHAAYYERGRIRLNRYDSEGLDDIYAAMEENANYIEDGLGMIGDYCCMAGLQEELERYREKESILLQKVFDENMNIQSISRQDKLSAEHLPDGVLEGILEYIESVSEGTVEKVYLLRKTVSETFFSSAVILKFVSGTDDEKKEEVFHRVFRYLDTTSDWQYSLHEFGDVPAGILEKTPEYLVWQKAEEPESTEKNS